MASRARRRPGRGLLREASICTCGGDLVKPKTGWLTWVDGYWRGRTWVPGYYRSASKPSMLSEDP